MTDISKRLQAPFPSRDIEWRIQRAGVKNGNPWAMVLAYVTNRAIQNRLDEVFGEFGWQNEFKGGPGGGVICGISVLSDSGWVTKWDGADNTQIEEVKGGLSGAMKRAAVQWGIGRYLYNLEATWAQFHDGGSHTSQIEGKYYKWDPPPLPDWALPEEERGKAKTPPKPPKNGHKTAKEYIKMKPEDIPDEELGEAFRLLKEYAEELEVDPRAIERVRDNAFKAWEEKRLENLRGYIDELKTLLSEKAVEIY